MDPKINPYSPGAGTIPPQLAGRDEIINKVDIALERCRTGLSFRGFLLVGLRGVGKTVLLTKITQQAESKGFAVVSLETPEGRSLPALLIPALRSALLRLDRMKASGDLAKKALRTLGGFLGAMKIKYEDVEFSLDLGKEIGIADSGDLEQDLTDLLIAVGAAAKEKKSALVLAIDEIHNVIDFLEPLETTDDIKDVDFLELRACDESCAGGVLMPRNRFLVVERLRKKAFEMKEGSIVNDPAYQSALNYLEDNLALEEIHPRGMNAFGTNMEQALKKMQQVRNMMCYLPGIDCGACGAPNCLSLAEDITRREAKLSNCVFLHRMMEKQGKIGCDHAIRIIETTWGKDRLEKNCRKKDAGNESE